MADEIGVIFPPPHIRTTVDKTAEFVHKFGDTFEAKLLARKDQKLNFLLPDDPYRKYYEYRVAQYK